ncbi:MAG: hypothetical protein ACQEQF_07950 [Bacillota bacterium]
MDLLKNQNFTFVFLLILYFIPCFLGNLIVKSNHKVKINGATLLEQNLADPLTLKLYQKIKNSKEKKLKNKNYFSLIILLLFEKIFLELLIIRVLYGIIFVIPIFINIWNGFSKGVLFYKSNLSILKLIEDISYIMASVFGINIGINIFEYLFFTNKLNLNINLSYLFFSMIFTAFSIIISFYFSFFDKKD